MNLNSHVACNDVIVVSQGRYANIMMLHSFSAIQSQYSSLFFPCKANWRRFEERRFLPLPIRKLGQPCEFFWGIKTQYSKFVGFWLHVFPIKPKGTPRLRNRLEPPWNFTRNHFWLRWTSEKRGGWLEPVEENNRWLEIPCFPMSDQKQKITAPWMWQRWWLAVLPF